MGETFKSIFRQRQCEKLYHITRSYFYLDKYKFEYYANANNVLSDNQLTVHDVEAPLLEPGEHFFLHDLQKEIVIKSRLRSSDGTTVYYAEDEVIETENTKKSLEECKEELFRYEELNEEINKLKKKFEEYKEKYKYEHRFFNFK